MPSLPLPAHYRRSVLLRVQWLILVGLVFELLMIGNGAYSSHVAYILLLALIITGITLWLTLRAQYNFSAYLLLLMVLLLATGLAYRGQGIHDIALLIYPANLVLGGLLLRPREYLLMTFATLLMVLGLGLAEAYEVIQPTIKYVGINRIRYELITLLVILLLIAAMVHMLVQGVTIFFNETQQKSQTLETLYRQLQAEVEERRAAQNALQSLNQELQNSNRELESFSYSVSHDLRAPLRTIHGFAMAIKEDYQTALAQEGNQLLDRVLHAALRMDNLITDLLRFAQISRQALRDERIDCDALVNEVVTELQEQQHFHGRLIIEPLQSCRGDRGLLRQVWVNVINNAMKFSRDNSNAEIVVAAARDDQFVHFSVSDNGVGFDMKFEDKLFGVFHRLHAREQFEGTGIGLALCRRIIERHGGRISAHAEVGKGATFTFSLPL